MKKIFLAFSLFIVSSSLFAKKIKFSVDMDTVTINVNGVHITGDFQDEAGFPADWDPASTQMTPEVADPSIYSVVLDIPAFRHYEFKFVNGIFGYEVEFVPSESRVGYLFNDNRWIYLDSLSNDTQVVAPVIYSMNAPAGKYLLRLRVDMRNVPSVSPNGVHVIGDFQGWDTTATYLYSFDTYIYEYITYVDSGMPSLQHEFKYFNGNSAGTQETVPMACATVNGNRGAFVTSDVILQAVCFSSCSPCLGNEVVESENNSNLNIYPNPSNGAFTVYGFVSPANHLDIIDMYGKPVYSTTINSQQQTINIPSAPGIYFVRITSGEITTSSKLIIE